MKILSLLLPVFFFSSCAKGNEKVFTASTPADAVVRRFIRISLSDSVDFIRWKLAITNNTYTLSCHYGVGKPNTNGFMQGGSKKEMQGVLEKKGDYYQLKNGNAVLHIMELNENLLHILDSAKKLLVGNGGWSYTLNNMKPVASDKINMQSAAAKMMDSVVYDGRTPCGIPGVVPDGNECYKLKWRIILYSGSEKEGACKILGTAWRNGNGQTGKWNLRTGKNGRLFYDITCNSGKTILHLLQADENILLFTDAGGNLLTGDEDFSYTLNRK